MGELTLIRKPGIRGDLCQRQFTVRSQELLGPLDAARYDILVRGTPVAALNCRAKW